jgi:signal transduction histidine kinase
MPSSNQSILRLNDWLYRGRVLFAAVALLFVLYNAIFFIFYVPFGGPYVHWRPDSRLLIDRPTEQSAQLMTGDEVLSIGDQPLIRTRPIYPLPLQTEYYFTIQRNGEIQTIPIPVYAPVNAYAINTFLATILLSVAGWLVGVVMVFVAHKSNHQALYAGYIFLLSAMVIIGIQGSLEGVPGAWVAGNCLIYILAVSWIYLGLIPRSHPLSPRSRRIIGGLYAAAGVLALVATYEVLFLFPQRSSFQEIVGISLYGLSFLLSAVGLLGCVLILAIRIWRLPTASYIRQQLGVLLIFFAIGVFPTVLLTIIPRVLLDVVFLPFPVAIGLMIFIPAGYLFVIYRRGFLGLDPFFNQTVFLTMLALIVFGFYASGLYLVQRLLHLEASEAVIPATVIFFPTLLLTVYASKPVNLFVQHLIYGKGQPDDKTLTRFTVALSANPEFETLNQIVLSLGQMLQIPQVSLFLRNETGAWVAVSQMGMDGEQKAILAPTAVRPLSRPVLRSAVRSAQHVAQFFQPFSWAELLIPVMVRNEQAGVLAFSRPGNDGYFNAQQVTFLKQVAGILAVGSDNVSLFETTRALARQALTVQESERKTLASQIHDEPLQQLSYVSVLINQMRHAPHETEMGQFETVLHKAITQLNSASAQLRQICIGLRPPFWDQGVELAVREVVDQIQNQYDLNVQIEVALGSQYPRTSEITTLSLCRILNEALNNVVKHAPGATVCVGLACEGAQLHLTVQDNGPGCYLPDTSQSFGDLIRQHHFGIVGMLEWAKMAQGELKLCTQPGQGMRVAYCCPMFTGETYEG